MEKIKTILRYVFGIIYVIAGLALASTSIITTCLFLVAGIFIIPYTHNLILGNIGIVLSRPLRYIIPALLVVIGTGLATPSATPSTDGPATTSADEARDLRNQKYEDSARKAIEETTAQLQNQIDHPEQYITFGKYDLSLGGFGNVGFLNCVFKNKASIPYKDIQIRVQYLGKSGTLISEEDYIILDILKAGSSLKVKKFNLGFVNSQFASYNIQVVGATVYK